MRLMGAGVGAVPLRSVAAEKEDRSLPTSLTRSDAEEGTLWRSESSSVPICGFMRFSSMSRQKRASSYAMSSMSFSRAKLRSVLVLLSW